ncbi:tetratricopeptide repeat (TPR)-like superfamily protein [Actinidia rufa]|uniref:Tetratricopeptide repeat (TPR)-like superfamily protein n=1 Tax=Actinidia rufa TaxID=165716 RepID=A0A7J0FT15_9ERIC|nr:tetratricopeptide repeat (TPR)-like superfamily protein [Actinidia rufa]
MGCNCCRKLSLPAKFKFKFKIHTPKSEKESSLCCRNAKTSTKSLQYTLKSSETATNKTPLWCSSFFALAPMLTPWITHPRFSSDPEPKCLSEGREIHAQALKLNLSSIRSVRMKLLELYGKCGEFGDAWQIGRGSEECFDWVQMKDKVCWTAMVDGLVRNGEMNRALERFWDMQREGVKERDVTTYNSMVSGLALNGKSTEAMEVFRDMVMHGVTPTNVTFHYGCMVDLLGRVGLLEEAFNFIRSMKQAPDHIIWGALLSACKIHRNFELGEKIAQILLDCGDADSGTCVLLYSVCASLGKSDEAAQVRAKMKAYGILL